MTYDQGSRPASRLALYIVVLILTGSLLTVTVGYISVLRQIDGLRDELASLQNSMGNVSLTELYEEIRGSVVMIRGFVVYYSIFGREVSQVQGSGFVYESTSGDVVVTNFHVVNGAVNITVTLSNGNAYTASVLGSDAYYDLAVLSVDAPATELKQLQVVSSSTLKVGDLIIAVGNPFGLTGSMTTGIVSQLGRTITEDTTGGYPIANVIQISAPINPGNSGGPLLNARGQVVGLTTAVVADSQGVGFAIPSNAILREIEALIENGSYNKHPWLGIAGTDMDFEIAKYLNINMTYGLLIAHVTNGGPAQKAGLLGGTQQVVIGGSMVTVGGDIITEIDGTRIMNSDDLSTYLEEKTQPNQTINVTIVRNRTLMNVDVILGTRPPPS